MKQTQVILEFYTEIWYCYAYENGSMANPLFTSTSYELAEAEARDAGYEVVQVIAFEDEEEAPEPAAPTTVDSKQGDVLSKEGIKAKAEDLAKALGYNSNSLSLEVINVKDAFCIGYSEGRKESSPTLLKENGELKAYANYIGDKIADGDDELLTFQQWLDSPEALNQTKA